MNRRNFMGLVASAAIAAASLIPGHANAAEALKIGTLAPASSPWGQVFKIWQEAVKKKSDGKLELQFFYSGQQGDEADMVAKMKSGQLDGAAVTAVGLSKIHKPILALQMPGLFTTWAKLDTARDAMRGDFEKGLKDGGFTLLGWGDVGQAHVMSKGFQVKVPDDFKGKKPYMWRDDIVQPIVYQAIGGVSPVPLNVPEVLPQLNTGAINIVNAPALAAEQLQWASKLDHIIEDVGGCAIGALLVASPRLDALPADLKQIVIDTGAIASKALTTRIRNEDAAAFARLKGKMTTVKLSPEEQAKWSALFKQVRERLAQGTFPAELVSKLEGLAK